MIKNFKSTLLVGLLGLLGASAARAENIKLRIASGHPAVNTYVNLMQTFFVPEVSKRVAARTQHKVEFVEGYGGSMVKLSDTLEGVLGFSPDLFGDHAAEVFGQIDAIQILACGTSLYAGMTARYWLEAVAGIPTNVEIASEYRYRTPAVNPRALCRNRQRISLSHTRR